MQEVRYETFDSPVSIYNFEVEDFHTYYVGENPVLVHNKCIAKDGDYKAIVNEFNEHEAPHAHILKNGQRIAKVDANSNIIKGLSVKGVQKFVSKHKSAIIDGIREYYPRRM